MVEDTETGKVVDTKDFKSMGIGEIGKLLDRCIASRQRVLTDLGEKVRYWNNEIKELLTQAGLDSVISGDWRCTYVKPTQGRSRLVRALLIKNGVSAKVLEKSTKVGKVPDPYIMVKGTKDEEEQED